MTELRFPGFPPIKGGDPIAAHERADNGTVIDFGAHYQVRGYAGVAFYLVNWATQWTEENWELVCADEQNHDVDDHYADTSHNIAHPECWLYSEPEEVQVRSRVRAVMVGDDTIHEIDVEDLAKINDDDYCRECGSTTCMAVRYE